MGSPLRVKTEKITIIVGPNNSGKSKTLKEIEYWSFASTNRANAILDKVAIQLPNGFDEISSLFSELKADPRWLYHKDNETYSTRIASIKQEELDDKFSLDQKTLGNLARSQDLAGLTRLTRFYTLKLDGRTRFDVLSPRPAGDLKEPARNFMASLFHRDVDRENISDKIHEEFGKFLYLDPTNGSFVIRLNEEYRQNTKTFDEDYLAFLRNSPDISQFSDGLQAYVAILLSVSSFNEKIILIDEPEAFLHPPAAYTLASNLTDIASKRHASLIISTHSPDFVMGCVEKSENVTVIRLTYDGEKGTTRQLSVNDVKEFVNDPLLRHANTITALFHKSAVVVEGDTDRVLYSEINRRLNVKNEGIEEVIFLNVNSKYKMHRVFRPLRKIGVPSACIYDLDVIKFHEMENEHKTLWHTILKAANVPDEETLTLETERAFLEDAINCYNENNKPVNAYSKGGVSLLGPSEQTRAQSMITSLKKYGIFIIPNGQLESWLPSLGVVTEKKYWLSAVLEKLNKENIQPSKDDVWQFISEIDNWVSDPLRLGIPDN